MQGLQLIAGRKDGDLALDANITRAELVTIIVRAFGNDTEAKLLKGAPSFPDVGSHWASGYIAVAKNLAKQTGEVLGRPDGTFNPDGNVTQAEALAFVMKFMGIKPEEGSKWPDNYINGAVNAGLITEEDGKAVSAGKNTAANRGLVFYLADSGFSTYKLANGKTVYTTYVDSKPPSLTVETPPSESAENQVALKGTAEGAAFVTLDGKKVSVGADGKWTGTLELGTCGDTYPIVASDLAGNTVTKEVTIKWKGAPKGVSKDVYACKAN
nr:S-layer homology domain-containing protein [Cohnella sp. CFH 77786]